MKVLILGGHGMAGHMIREFLLRTTSHEVWTTVRKKTSEEQAYPLDVTRLHNVSALLNLIRPDVVINTVGILNEAAANRPLEAIKVNSLLPHHLAACGWKNGFKLIHISTDCVFSGSRGNYIESDVPDGTTPYARTKALGEVADSRHLTIRTSIVGPERKSDGIGLLHWLMNQQGVVQGYRQVFWNGVTTLELAKAIQWILEREICGLVHLTAPEKISKYQLLQLMKEVFGRDQISIQADDSARSDKSLVNTRSDFAYPSLPYETMMSELQSWMSQLQDRYSYAE